MFCMCPTWNVNCGGDLKAFELWRQEVGGGNCSREDEPPSPDVAEFTGQLLCNWDGQGSGVDVIDSR